MRHAVALTGPSGSGKSTAIVSLIRHYIADGLTVGAIKHTHHAVNDDHRGDSALFRDAGADPVILAGANRAVLFGHEGTRHLTFPSPDDLLKHLPTDIVLIEGFKNAGSWPRIQLESGSRHSTAELVALIQAKWRGE